MFQKHIICLWLYTGVVGKQQSNTISRISNGSSCHFCLAWTIEIHPQPKSILYSFQTLAEQLTDKELEEGRLYPPLSNIREVSVQMAVKVSLLKTIIYLARKTKGSNFGYW